MLKATPFIGFLLILFACSPEINETTLTAEDIDYIKSINVLEDGESIEMIESQGGQYGIKESGNMMTDKRLASWWIDNREELINSAFYDEIDSLAFFDKVNAVTLSSYIEVHQGRSWFYVYIDADSARTWAFFNQAKANWEQHRNNL